MHILRRSSLGISVTCFSGEQLLLFLFSFEGAVSPEAEDSLVNFVDIAGSFIENDDY